MPRLSLCLIARDESQFIAQCLASVAGVVDEVVVCDTGSVDNTVALAENAGAKVVHHVWNDDFSSARNAALEAASGDWVLVLDADEVLAPGAGPALRAAVEAGEVDCGLLLLHHADGLDARPSDVLCGRRRHEEPTALARLFRNTPELRWEGVIHELPSGWLAAPDRTIGLVRANIVHYGNVPDLREAKNKAARNLRLLERACWEDPDDIARRTYLARERWRAGDVPAAMEDARQAWEALQAKPPSRVQPFAVTTTTLHVYFLLAVRKTSEALGCLAVARTWNHPHPNLATLWAAALLEKGGASEDRLRAALKAVREEALDVAGDAFIEELLPGATGAMAHRLAGELCTALGEVEAALSHLRTAHSMDAGDPVISLTLAEALLAARRSGEALKLVEPMLASGLPDAWLLAAEAAAQVGQRDQAAPLLQRAASSDVKWMSQQRASRIGRRLAEQRAWQRLKQLTSGRTPPPHPTPVLARQTAVNALKEGRIGLAMQVLPQVLSAQPGDAEAWAVLATALFRQGVTPLAVDLLSITRSLAPHHPRALALLIEMANKAGNMAAVRTWQRVARAYGVG